jgi:CHAT domain-containing protein/tetratricopeptide (TPR) repeat protein
VVDALLAAEAAGDDAASTAAAEKPVDPVWVEARLLGNHVEDALASPPRPSKALDAARRYARLVAGKPSGRAAAAWVASWGPLDRAALERLARLRDAAERARELREKNDLEGLRAHVAAQAADAAAFPSKEAADLGIDLGAALTRASRLPEAFDAFRSSLDAARRMPWPVGMARAGAALGDLGFRVGRAEEALAAVTESVRALEEAGFDARSGGARVSRAMLLTRLGRCAEALQEARRARAISGAAKDVEATVEADLATGAAATALGRTDEARAAFDDAVASLKATGHTTGVGLALLHVASIHGDHDRPAEALAAIEAADPYLPPRSTLRASWLSLLGSTYRRLGRIDRAIEYQSQALALATELKHPRLVSTALGNLGNAYVDLHRLDEAIPLLERALEAKVKAGEHPESIADTHASLARALRLAGRPDDAVPLVEKARAGYVAAGSLVRAAMCRTQAGMTEEARGRLDAAYAAHRAAVAELEALGDASRATADAMGALARVCLLLGRGEEAVEAGRRSSEAFVRLASGLGETDAEELLATSRRVADRGVEAAWTLAASDPRRAAEAAYGFVESSRAILLATGLVNAPALLAAEVSPDVLADEAGRRSAVAATRAALVRAAASGDAARMASARAAHDAAAKAHGEAVARLERESSRLAGVAFPRPPAPDEVRARLGPDEALVLYHATDDSLFALVLTKAASTLLRLADGPAVRADVEAWTGQASTPGADDLALARRLGSTLVAPVDRVAGRPRRLVVAPDALLAFLPFAALALDVDGKPRRLVLDREVVLVPSATVATALGAVPASARGRGLVAVGDPDYGPAGAAGLPPLPGSGAEVREIASLFPEAERTLLVGKAATPAALRAALSAPAGRLAAVHVAAHAFVDPERPRRSALVLADGEAFDLDDVHRLRTAADVVVLSACSTGKGKVMRGEGVVGFARGFFLAGVPRVVVSQWVVSDESSRALVKRLYEGLVKEALPPAAALRGAQRALLESGGPWSHPYHWAAFALWGRAD